MMGGGHQGVAGKAKQRFRPHVFKTLLNERLWGLLVLERAAGRLFRGLSQDESPAIDAFERCEHS